MTLSVVNATSFSDLLTFGRCPNKYKYRAVYRIQPKKRAGYFRLGAMVHKMFEVQALGADLGQFYREQLDTITNNPALFEEEKTDHVSVLDDAGRIVAGYFAAYADSYQEWEILHVEETFFIMLDSGETLSFTPDLVVRDRNGFVWIVDRKTTSSTPKEGLPFADLQALLYFAGVKALYPELRGFIFDRLRKKVPTQPRLTKTGTKRVADLERIDTTYEILRNFLETEAPDLLDDLGHRRRLAELRDQNRFYFRETVIVTEEQMKNVLADVVAHISLLRRAQERDLYPRVYQSSGMGACDQCEMQKICQAELLGWDAQRVLDEYYEPRDDSHKQYETEEE